MSTFPDEAKSTGEPVDVLGDVELTAAEQELFTGAFLADLVDEAMQSVQSLEDRASLRLSRILAVRDVLFADWVREQFGLPVSAQDAEVEWGASARDRPPGAPLAAHDQGVVVASQAELYERVNNYLVHQNVTVAEYLRVIDALRVVDSKLSRYSPDKDVQELVAVLTTLTPNDG